MTNRTNGNPPAENVLGTYLRERRARLDPMALGYPSGDAVPSACAARRSRNAPTSVRPAYTCLEQGRGGAPSADVLDRISRALLLTDAEREHLFLLGLGHPPEVRFHRKDGVSPRLQRVLDVFDPSPALIRTAVWMSLPGIGRQP